MFTRYKRTDAFHKAHAPPCCGVQLKSSGSSKDVKRCRWVPTFHLESGEWVCGKHLEAAISPECSVCFNKMPTRQQRLLPCGHTFHTKCVDRWSKLGNRTCPLCRAEYAPPPTEVETNPHFHHGDQIQVVISIVVTELVEYGRILPDTVTAIREVYGEDWWMALSNWLGIPIDMHGTAEWSAINYENETLTWFAVTSTVEWPLNL